MKTDDFDYYLPEELIAQVPLEHREESRLLVLDKNNGNMIDDKFYDIVNYLNKGDILVLNDTKVMPARLIGEKEDTGAVIEVLLLKNINTKIIEFMIRAIGIIEKTRFLLFLVSSATSLLIATGNPNCDIAIKRLNVGIKSM